MVSKRDMEVSPTALLTVLALADEHGDARAAIRANGLEAEAFERMDGVGFDLTRRLEGLDRAVALDEAAAIGFLAGRAAHRLRALDVSSFLMDHDLVVRGAEGRSILRLPWFAQDLFVARQLPDITEMPVEVRTMAVSHYRKALRGQRGSFEFTSYGLRFAVQAVPVRGEDGRVRAVLGVARPAVACPAGTDDRLTARELEMLQLAADGLSGPQIAELLVLSPGTVKTHFQNIYKKWGVSDRAGAVARALREGLIS
jgi:DNA-binding CsgD family transcriptional regulator